MYAEQFIVHRLPAVLGHADEVAASPVNPKEVTQMVTKRKQHSISNRTPPIRRIGIPAIVAIPDALSRVPLPKKHALPHAAPEPACPAREVVDQPATDHGRNKAQYSVHERKYTHVPAGVRARRSEMVDAHHPPKQLRRAHRCAAARAPDCRQGCWPWQEAQRISGSSPQPKRIPPYDRRAVNPMPKVARQNGRRHVQQYGHPT